MAFASTAQAGITIPAGDWTLDVGGVVNAYYTSTRHTGDDSGGYTAGANAGGNGRTSNITTGLLPNYLSVSGKSRQNDLDVAFTVSIQPGASNANSLSYGDGQENRQAFMTFGDASWGSVKVGKDLGIFASDAILNDMTLLGVGSAAGTLVGNTTTLGRIGSGYIYADWKPQIAYTSPNWNGFQFTAGVTQAWNALANNGYSLGGDATTSSRGGSAPAFEGKASYSWTGDVAGKVWVSALSQKLDDITNGVPAYASATAFVSAVPNTAVHSSDRANAWDIGANVNVANFGLTAYYFKGDGIGSQYQFRGALDKTGKTRDSDGGYVQATYVLPTSTKLGVSWGESKLDSNSADTKGDLTTRMWTVGAYHPLTKSVNLVAEYSSVKDEQDSKGANASLESKAKTVSLGAILFF